MQNQHDHQKIIKVAFTSPGWPRSAYPNGIVTYISNLVQGFNSQVKPIILSAPILGNGTDPALIDLSGIHVKKNKALKLFDALLFRLNFKFTQAIQYKKTALLNAKKIYLATQSCNPAVDLIEMEESFGTPYFLLNLTKTPIITRLHGPWFMHGPIMKMDNDSSYQMRVFYEGEAIKNSDGVTAPSMDVLEKTRQYYGIDLPYAEVIPNPVCEVDIEKRWQYGASKKSILVVGRFDLHKGGDLALEAFRLIALEKNSVELLFVGPDKGVTIDNKSLSFDEYIKRFIPEDSIKNRIQFLGHCDQERIADLRKNALVTMVCSRYETFSIALVESLAAGCPTVATAVGGMKEIIIDDFNGLLAESESAESIAEKVLMLISDPEKMQRFSKNAIEDCKKRFSPEVVAAQTLAYYQSVLARVAEESAKH